MTQSKPAPEENRSKSLPTETSGVSTSLGDFLKKEARFPESAKKQSDERKSAAKPMKFESALRPIPEDSELMASKSTDLGSRSNSRSTVVASK
eukprot:CAMPEP_0174892092 /NCGR_PEP_ID=MMETSP0167-20121228/7114_1 /TAXON_ID=38298 /ORGANISM="Rhodella maculata, Strain CCMP736" /LENGTH=92 /DNA_ID=CAMNT_0016130485 /DNA_START=63 /DNA_END=341 /DNA_ORIENTATION=-